MEKIDISLVPIEDLIDEIYKRTVLCVIGYLRQEDIGDPFIYVNWSEGSEMAKIGLCEAIKHRIFTQRDIRLEKE